MSIRSLVSIPFEQGNVFRRNTQYWTGRGRSLNPFRSGRCLSTVTSYQKVQETLCLNPFRSGRCLSTGLLWTHTISIICLNPFRSGQCLSTSYPSTNKKET